MRPMPGSVSDRGWSPSPMRIAARPPLGCLLRTRNDGTDVVFFLNRGKPTRLPFRFPVRESDHAVKPLPRSTAASSNTCWHTSVRHRRPVTTGSATPTVSTVNTRPAASVFFHPLKVLIRSNPVQGTVMLGSVRRADSAVLTMRRHWLNANRAAPACRDSTTACSTVGSRQNLNVVCRVIDSSIAPGTDKRRRPGARGVETSSSGSAVLARTSPRTAVSTVAQMSVRHGCGEVFVRP